MKMKKRILALLMAALMCIMLFGCTQTTTEETDKITFAENAGVNVEKIENLSEDFVMGADVSSYLALEKSGVKFYDMDGNEGDLFEILADAGINTVRVRLFNDPYDAEGNTYGAGTCDLETVTEIGKRATKAGLGVMVDFHYSDFWADPGKQNAPKAWASMSLDEKKQALYDFTYDSIKTMVDAGVNVTYVQIGNEITSGMAGEYSDKKYELCKAGCEAVAAVDPSIQRIIHFTNPEKNNYESYAKALENAGVEYEVFASSYYSYWHGTLENLTAKLKAVADKYGKKVMCTETAWAWTWEDGDGQRNVAYEGREWLDASAYDISVQGQADMLHDVIEAVANVGDAGAGVCWWEIAWVPVNDVSTLTGTQRDEMIEENRIAWEENGAGWATEAAQEFDASSVGCYGGSEWDNQTMFDFTGKALPSLYTFKYVYAGASA